MIASTRALLQYAVVSAPAALSIPGPGTTQNALGRPVAIAAPVAMYAAPCSWRVTIGRMS